MKKLLACGLILSMLSSTGAMCFANEGVEVVNVVEVSATETTVTEESQENKTSQEELLSDIESIKNEKGLTVKEKFERAWASVKEFVEGSVRPEGRLARAWNYVKSFVSNHYKAIGGAVLLLLVAVLGPVVFNSLKGLLSSNNEDRKDGQSVREKKSDDVVVDEQKKDSDVISEEDKKNDDVVVDEQKKDSDVISEEDKKNDDAVVDGGKKDDAIDFNGLISKLNECKTLIDAGEVEDAQLASADVFEVLESELSLEHLADEFYDKIQAPLNRASLDDEELDEDIIDKIDAMIEKFESFQN